MVHPTTPFDPTTPRPGHLLRLAIPSAVAANAICPRAGPAAPSTSPSWPSP